MAGTTQKQLSLCDPCIFLLLNLGICPCFLIARANTRRCLSAPDSRSP